MKKSTADNLDKIVEAQRLLIRVGNILTIMDSSPEKDKLIGVWQDLIYQLDRKICQ